MQRIFLKVRLILHLLPLELLYGRDGKESEKKCDQNNLKDESGELLHNSGIAYCNIPMKVAAVMKRSQIQPCLEQNILLEIQMVDICGVVTSVSCNMVHKYIEAHKKFRYVEFKHSRATAVQSLPFTHPYYSENIKAPNRKIFIIWSILIMGKMIRSIIDFNHY